MLAVSDLSLRVGDFAVHDVGFTLDDGEYLILLGPSGAGKTVVLEAMAGLVRPLSGRVVVDSDDVTSKPPQARPFGYVHQDDTLFPHLTVLDNIAYGIAHLERRRRKARSIEVAQAVGVEHLLARRPGTLSGGEAHRVALARVLAREPRCVLLDEPLTGLDVAARDDLMALLGELNGRGVSFVHVTHDMDEALALAHRVGIMADGRLVQLGTPGEVFDRPASTFVARLVGIRAIFPGILDEPTGEAGTRTFHAEGFDLRVRSPRAAGPAIALVRPEHLTIGEPPPGNEQLEGTVTKVAPARRGLTVTVDVGAPLLLEVPPSDVADRPSPGDAVTIAYPAERVILIDP